MTPARCAWPSSPTPRSMASTTRWRATLSRAGARCWIGWPPTYAPTPTAPPSRSGATTGAASRPTAWGHAASSCSGTHNVRNALAALAATSALGIAPELTIAALAEYRGTRRRFELKGEAGGITVIDDYAHHPTEVRANLAAARDRYPRPADRRLSPAAHLLAHARAARRLGERLRRRRHRAHRRYLRRARARYARHRQRDPGAPDRPPGCRAVGGMAHAVEQLLNLLQPGDVLLTLGAGDGYQVGENDP